MWKDTTVRKIFIPVARKWGLLAWSLLPLGIALGATFFAFREGSPSVAGPARLAAVFSSAAFVVLLGIGLVQKARS